VTLEVGQLYEWTEAGSSGVKLVRALRIVSVNEDGSALCTVEHWRGRPRAVGSRMLFPRDTAHRYTLVPPEAEAARRDKPKKVRRKSALR
jgi:xanthine/CO dehydrogenase XdhC/CoxF family maturation factor